MGLSQKHPGLTGCAYGLSLVPAQIHFVCVACKLSGASMFEWPFPMVPLVGIVPSIGAAVGLRSRSRALRLGIVLTQLAIWLVLPVIFLWALIHSLPKMRY